MTWFSPLVCSAHFAYVRKKMEKVSEWRETLFYTKIHLFICLTWRFCLGANVTRKFLTCWCLWCVFGAVVGNILLFLFASRFFFYIHNFIREQLSFLEAFHLHALSSMSTVSIYLYEYAFTLCLQKAREMLTVYVTCTEKKN